MWAKVILTAAVEKNICEDGGQIPTRHTTRRDYYAFFLFLKNTKITLKRFLVENDRHHTFSISSLVDLSSAIVTSQQLRHNWLIDVHTGVRYIRLLYIAITYL